MISLQQALGYDGSVLSYQLQKPLAYSGRPPIRTTESLYFSSAVVVFVLDPIRRSLQ